MVSCASLPVIALSTLRKPGLLHQPGRRRPGMSEQHVSPVPDRMEAMPSQAREASSTLLDRLIEDLDDEQREAVQAPRGPVCVLAGAGTGKTRTITRRIAYLVAAGHVAPGQVLAVT